MWRRIERSNGAGPPVVLQPAPEVKRICSRESRRAGCGSQEGRAMNEREHGKFTKISRALQAAGLEAPRAKMENSDFASLPVGERLRPPRPGGIAGNAVHAHFGIRLFLVRVVRDSKNCYGWYVIAGPSSSSILRTIKGNTLMTAVWRGGLCCDEPCRRRPT